MEQVVGLENARGVHQVHRRSAEAEAHQPHRATHQVLIRDQATPESTVDAFLDQVDNSFAAPDI
ncbi:hypothetical protein D3C84_1134280 [compost metagenome]